jgi:hypothetical protein
MRLLFAVFLASIFALLWTAFSIARHIRNQGRMRQRQKPSGVIARDEQPPGVEATRSR